MPKLSIPRKSTWVDMTAFVDVAFLILSFFMLATKFKPPEAIEVEPPSSVSSDIIPTEDAFKVSFDKDGKVFVTYDKTDKNLEMADWFNKNKGTNLTDQEKKVFTKLMEGGGVGVPFSQMKSLLSKGLDEAKKVQQPGIPVADSTNNQLIDWVNAVLSANGGRKPANILINGDNATKYPYFKEVLAAFKKNGVFSFKLVTAVEAAPEGTALYVTRQEEASGKKK